jgi:phosphatidylinositol alpha-mannosyltransferase
MKIGFVSPYAWDIPGGVQIHIRDLAEHYLSLGHEVSVLTPAVDEKEIQESYVVFAGKPLSIPYNGAVARVLFGPIAAARVRQWIEAHDFDVLHLHEPAIPSLSLLACSIAEGPMVGTFHVSAPKAKIAFAIAPFVEPIMEKLRGRIAVSEVARETLTIHLDTDAVVIPNGIKVANFTQAREDERWRSDLSIGFIGRFDEPRKGLHLLFEAIPTIVEQLPQAHFFIAGPGDHDSVLKLIDERYLRYITFTGRLSDQDKANFLRSCDLYIAPNTGGESFGIILIEAMAAGTPVIASDIQAFSDVLDGGKCGALFTHGDSGSLAEKVISVVKDDSLLFNMQTASSERAKRFDWSIVGDEIFNVYLHSRGEDEKVTVGSDSKLWYKIRNFREGSAQ